MLYAQLRSTKIKTHNTLNQIFATQLEELAYLWQLISGQLNSLGNQHIPVIVINVGHWTLVFVIAIDIKRLIVRNMFIMFDVRII